MIAFANLFVREGAAWFGDDLPLTEGLSWVDVLSMKLAMAFPILIFVLTSCQGEKEDEALVKKYEEKQATIESLEDELRKVRLAIDETEIPDPAPDLRKVKTEIKTANNEREELEDEIRKLEARKKQATADLQIYKGKYPLRSK